MKVQQNLQPNCSELALSLEETDICSLVHTCRHEGFEVHVYYKGAEYSALPAGLIEALVLRFHNGGNAREQDRVENFLSLAALKKDPALKAAVSEMLAHDRENWDVDSPEVCLYKNGESIRLQIGDYCSGGNHLAVEIGDCDTERFPLLAEIEKTIGGEPYGVDGGHTDDYEEWKTNNQKGVIK